MPTPEEALFKKLQIKPGMRIAVLRAPAEYAERLEHLPEGVTCATGVSDALDLIQVFATEKAAVLAEAPALAKALTPKGILWVAYPKGKKLATDVNRDILREALAPLGLEAVSIVAIDDVWSALRFKRV